MDADRRGLEDFRARAMKNAAVNLQRFITAYQVGHTTTYLEADLDTQEYAMIGNLPTGAIPHAFYIYSTAVDSEGDAHPDCNRNRLDYWDWNNRQFLICNNCEKRLYAYSIAPQGRMFIIRPLLNDDTKLLLVWQGIKSEFDDADVVPWPEAAAEAVTAFVKWRILLEIDKNPALAQTQFAIWSTARLALFRDEQEKLDAEKKDQEYPSSIAPAAPANDW